jgi:hypothetical protein
MRFEVLTVVTMKSTTFGNLTPYSMAEIYRRNGGMCCVHLQGRRIRQPSKRASSIVPAACYLLVLSVGLLFDHEDGDITFLRNVDKLIPNYTASHTLQMTSLQCVF